MIFEIAEKYHQRRFPLEVFCGHVLFLPILIDSIILYLVKVASATIQFSLDKYRLYVILVAKGVTDYADSL